MSGGYVVLGECWSCGRRFTFNPHTVPSIGIDPVTNLPGDIGDSDPARAVRQPICATCIERANEKRAAEGREPIPVLPGAYDFVEGLP